MIKYCCDICEAPVNRRERNTTMPDLHCPICHIELMQHDIGTHLDDWVQVLLYGQRREDLHPTMPPPYSESQETAWGLVQQVWEMDLTATIHKDHIEVDGAADDPDTMYCVRVITGEAFPLRVTRAAIWSAAMRGKQ
jgi:hypothetical protein